MKDIVRFFVRLVLLPTGWLVLSDNEEGRAYAAMVDYLTHSKTYRVCWCIIMRPCKKSKLEAESKLS